MCVNDYGRTTQCSSCKENGTLNKQITNSPNKKRLQIRPSVENQHFFFFPGRVPRQKFAYRIARHKGHPNGAINKHHNDKRAEKPSKKVVKLRHGSAKHERFGLVFKIPQNRHAHDGGGNKREKKRHNDGHEGQIIGRIFFDLTTSNTSDRNELRSYGCKAKQE